MIAETEKPQGMDAPKADKPKVERARPFVIMRQIPAQEGVSENEAKYRTCWEHVPVDGIKSTKQAVEWIKRQAKEDKVRWKVFQESADLNVQLVTRSEAVVT